MLDWQSSQHRMCNVTGQLMFMFTVVSVIAVMFSMSRFKFEIRFAFEFSTKIYEGRSINKLQNGAIPLILKIGKIRNIHFVGNLILKIHRNFF